MGPSSSRLQSPPRIFMSHSHLDDEFGLRLARDLRRVLGEESAVWYDASGDLHGGDAWWRKIVTEITSRTTFLVILSPESMASSWVNDEIDLAWSQKNARGMLIVPILLRPCEIRADLTTRQIISFLSPVSYETALRSLLVALNLPTVVPPTPAAAPIVTSLATPAPVTPSPHTPPLVTPDSAPAQVHAPEQISPPNAPARPPRIEAPFTLLLLSITGAFAPVRVAVERDDISIGRDRGNTVVLADDAVSRFHLRLTRSAHDPRAWHVRTSPGAGRVFVNAVPVEESPVAAGDQVVFGGVVLRMEPENEDRLVSTPRFTVEFEDVRFTAPLRSALVSMGRNPRSGIVIPSPLISAQHATAMLATDGSVTVEDMGSRNGLYQQGSRVQRATLRSGEHVMAGAPLEGVTLTYRTGMAGTDG